MEDKNDTCKICYVCEGECAARLTEEEYVAHETKVCGAENCSHKGAAFVRKECAEHGDTCESC